MNLKNTGRVRNTYDSDDPTDPRKPSVDYPNSIAEVSLHDEGSNCSHGSNVYGGKMGIPEAPRRQIQQRTKSRHRPHSAQFGWFPTRKRNKLFRVHLDMTVLPSNVEHQPRNFTDRESFGKL